MRSSYMLVFCPGRYTYIRANYPNRSNMTVESTEHNRELRPVVTVKEAGDYLRVSKSTIYRLLNEGLLRRRKVGSRTLIDRSDIEALIS